MSKTYVLSLADARATLERVGGKGASLARLVRAGLAVPDGFHVTTAAYRHFVDENGLQAQIVRALDGIDLSSPPALQAASQTIKALFAKAAMPGAIASAVAQAYAALAGQVVPVAGESQNDSFKHQAVPVAGGSQNDSFKHQATPVAGESQNDSFKHQAVPVAVRSSATAEDLPEASFAGQQETYLNVRGESAVLEAVQACWASLWTARAIGYRARQGIDHDTVSLAVVVQLLVPAEAAGIMFTANPMNGRRDQVTINASWGLGEAIVGGEVTPDTLIVDKSGGGVIERQTADKQTMTVRTPAGTASRPVPEQLRRAPVLDDDQAAELARLGVQIEQHYGMPMDVEWAVTGGGFSILQARPITALPEPARSTELDVEPPTEWVRPDPKALAFRGSVAELLPDPMSPLFSTLGLRAINAGTVGLFTQVFGPGVIADNMVVSINGYAYYQMRMTFKLMWRLLLNVWSFLPEFFRGETRWRDEARPSYLAVIERWQRRPLREVAAADLLQGAYQIAVEATRIYNVFQSGVIGLAMGAEMLFAPFYEKLIRREGDPPALSLMLGGNSVPIMAEKSLYDVAQVCQAHPGLADYIVRTASKPLAAQLEGDDPPAGVGGGAWREWQRLFRAHLAQYGHAIYDLDFAKPVPADDPGPLLGMLKVYLDDQGADTYRRQQEQVARRESAARAIEKRLKRWRLKWFRKLLGWAQRYVPMREDTLSDIGLGYPLLRQMLRELGGRLVGAGMLEQVDDIYWLYETEAAQAAASLDRGDDLSQITQEIRRRQAVSRAVKRLTPPVALPERGGIIGLLEKLGPARTTQEEGDTIKGIGASPGQVTTRACVLRGPEDFDRMQPGAVLVAAITTPAWTPLFAMAAAVVTDVGGPLSHSSIVAREYGIPAVLGTGVATRRIQHGQTITVDGDEGSVTLL